MVRSKGCSFFTNVASRALDPIQNQLIFNASLFFSCSYEKSAEFPTDFFFVYLIKILLTYAYKAHIRQWYIVSISVLSARRGLACTLPDTSASLTSTGRSS